MIDYIELSQTTPCNEPCAQVGSENYMMNSRIETSVYIDQLIRTFGEPPVGCRFRKIECPHDFGPYLDIRFYYDDEDQDHVRYMINVEEGCETWDDIAIQALKAKKYKLPQNEGEGQDEPWYESYTNDNGPTGHGDICMSDADPGL